MDRVISGRPLVPGRAAGTALVATEPLSFWGGYDQHTGEIIDRRHPLSGRNAAGCVLVIPGSRGSSTTSAVFLEAVRLGKAPAAVLTSQVDTFLSLASVVADEMFGTTVPIVVIDPGAAAMIVDGMPVRVEVDGRVVVTAGG